MPIRARGGQLDPAERLRAQRWLTYERNELILGSALRIAREVEGKTELHKTVRTEPASPYAADRGQVRDESTLIDRTGAVARFLRLAFRVNMEQLALVEKEAPLLPAELSAEELAAEAARDAVADEELDAVEQQQAEIMENHRREQAARVAAESAADAAAAAASEQHDRDKLRGAPASLHSMHNLHNSNGQNIAATADVPCTCAAEPALERIAEDACIGTPPEDEEAIESQLAAFGNRVAPG